VQLLAIPPFAFKLSPQAPGQNPIESTVCVAPQEFWMSTALCGAIGVLNDVWMPSLPPAFSIPADGGA
jgi:hypothetical protein